ncbi:hypothetical protein [Nocardiopsis protaetiae]|uniref:hypothetical protein n=2 Tax=Nocardiopsis protaetiae TaxID=3382270 RepID=UPI00387B15FE
MAHPPMTANVSANAAGPDSYEKWYKRRVAAFHYLFGTSVTVGGLHFAAGFHDDNVEVLDLVGRSMPGWEAAGTVESATAHLAFLLFPAMGAAFFGMPWTSPKDLPAGVSAKRFRTAEMRIRYGVVGGDPETDHVARIAAESLIRRVILDPRILLAFQVPTLGFMLFMTGSGLVWGWADGDTVLVLRQGGALLLFVCLFAVPWRLVLLRRRALEFRNLHEALLRRLHGTGR